MSSLRSLLLKRFGHAKFFQRRNHREHHSQRPVYTGTEQCPQLNAEKLLLLQTKTNGAEAFRRRRFS